MFQKNAKHRANDASNDVHRPPLDMPRFAIAADFCYYFFATFTPCQSLAIRDALVTEMRCSLGDS